MQVVVPPIALELVLAVVAGFMCATVQVPVLSLTTVEPDRVMCDVGVCCVMMCEV
jgi:hypothetical protein